MAFTILLLKVNFDNVFDQIHLCPLKDRNSHTSSCFVYIRLLVVCRSYWFFLILTCDSFPPSSFQTFRDMSMDPVTTCCKSAVTAKQVTRSACDTDRLSSPLSTPVRAQIRTELSPSDNTYRKENVRSFR